MGKIATTLKFKILKFNLKNSNFEITLRTTWGSVQYRRPCLDVLQ